MSVKITMPALSPTMKEGNLAKWLVKEGDAVKSGDIVAEIETDKATMEVDVADEGVVAKIIVPAGTAAVKINTLIAVLAEEGEDVAEVAKAAESAALAAPANSAGSAGAAQNESEKPKHASPAAIQPAAGHEVSETAADKIFASPLAKRLAAEDGLELTQIQGTGPHGRIVARDIAAGAGTAGKIFASPLARRLAAQSGLDLGQIQGTGPRGRIVARDIAAAKAKGVSAASAANRPAAFAAMDEEAVLKLFKPEDYEIVPHASMRQTIARRLVESKQTVPHFYVTADCLLDNLLKLRSELNAAAPVVKKGEVNLPAYKLSVNDMIIKAVALALKQLPAANVSWLDSGMLRHKHSDIGVAVSIPNGLITPIVRCAEEKSLSAISNEMRDLIKRAKQMKLKPEEYQGGTSTVSNMGMFGVKNFSAIINPPQATIFAIGAGEKRAVVKDGALAVASVMSITISADHRTVDGALAAELAQCFKTIIENPFSMLV